MSAAPKTIADALRPRDFYECRFVVEGRGSFPLDMLRRDECFPASTADAVRLDQTLPSGPRRKVTLVHRCARRWWEPTAGRWESFGWKVVEVNQHVGEDKPLDISKVSALLVKLADVVDSTYFPGADHNDNVDMVAEARALARSLA